jgi:hypothetical protein
MRRLTCVLVAVAALVAPAGAGAAEQLGVKVDRTRIETQLGHTFSFRTTITNRGSTAAKGYVAHLNVVSYDPGVYVDPEDWSGARTRYLPAIPPARSVTVDWRLQAVNAGRFAVYVAVAPPSGSVAPPSTGPAIPVAIAERKTLNSQGILPLAVGMPALLGLVWLGTRVRRPDRRVE